MSGQGVIGVRSKSDQSVLDSRQPLKVRSELKTLIVSEILSSCVIFGVI
jgi:hypothetical protein